MHTFENFLLGLGKKRMHTFENFLLGLRRIGRSLANIAYKIQTQYTKYRIQTQKIQNTNTTLHYLQ